MKKKVGRRLWSHIFKCTFTSEYHFTVSITAHIKSQLVDFHRYHLNIIQRVKSQHKCSRPNWPPRSSSLSCFGFLLHYTTGSDPILGTKYMAYIHPHYGLVQEPELCKYVMYSILYWSRVTACIILLVVNGNSQQTRQQTHPNSLSWSPIMQGGESVWRRHQLECKSPDPAQHWARRQCWEISALEPRLNYRL